MILNAVAHILRYAFSKIAVKRLVAAKKARPVMLMGKTSMRNSAVTGHQSMQKSLSCASFARRRAGATDGGFIRKSTKRV